MSVRHDVGISFLKTIEVRGDHFDLEIRSPSVFDEMFQDWSWV